MTTTHLPPTRTRNFAIEIIGATRASPEDWAPVQAQGFLDDDGFVMLISTRQKSPVTRTQQRRLLVLRPGDDIEAATIHWPGPGNKAMVIIDGQPVFAGSTAHYPIKPAQLLDLAATAREALRVRICMLSVICDAQHAPAIRTALEPDTAPACQAITDTAARDWWPTSNPTHCISCGAELPPDYKPGHELACGH